MAVNKSRRNNVYDYSYTITYDMDWSLYADSTYPTDQYTNIIRPYANRSKILYEFSAYTTDYQAMLNLSNFIKSLPRVVSCSYVHTYYPLYELDFTLEEIHANKVKDFMDNANRKAKMEDENIFPDWYAEKKDGLYDYVFNYENSDDLIIGYGRRNGKEIEKDMQKFTPKMEGYVKKVIYSGGKTIVIWLDNSKTIVSCGDGDQYDEYAGFCAALAKKIFGSTSAAKRVMNANKVINAPKELTQKEDTDYEVIKYQISENLKNALRECLNSIAFMDFQKKIDDIHSEKEKDDEQSE